MNFTSFIHTHFLGDISHGLGYLRGVTLAPKQTLNYYTIS